MSYWLCGIGTAEDSSPGDNGSFLAWCPKTPSGQKIRKLFGTRIDDFDLDNAHREDWLKREMSGGKENTPGPEKGKALIERILKNAECAEKVALFGTEYYEEVLPTVFPLNGKKFQVLSTERQFKSNKWFIVYDKASRLSHRVGIFSHPRYWPQADDSINSEQYRKYLVEVKEHNCKNMIFELASLFDDLGIFQETLIMTDVVLSAMPRTFRSSDHRSSHTSKYASADLSDSNMQRAL